MTGKKISVESCFFLGLVWIFTVLPLWPVSSTGDSLSPVRALDLLVVLDGTRSINRYTAEINGVFQHIDEHLKTKQSQEDVSVWTGVFIYRDRAIGCSGIPEFEWVSPLGEIPDKGIKPLMNSLFKSCDRDLPESVFRGLYLGTENSGFRPHARKVIIHIGDAGDHGRYETLEQVEKQLAEKQIHYYAVNLDGTSHFKESTAPLAAFLSHKTSGAYYDNIETFTQNLSRVLTIPPAPAGPAITVEPQIETDTPPELDPVKDIDIFHRIIELLGLEEEAAYLEQRPFLEFITLTAAIIILALIFYFFSKKVLVVVLEFFCGIIFLQWGKCLKKAGVFNVFNYILAGLVVYVGLGAFPAAAGFGRRMVEAFFILMFTMMVARLISAFVLVYEQWEISKKHPVRAYFQLLNIFIYILGFIFIVSHLINKSPLIMFSGVGALAAMFMFVFKNTILSFAANIQINSTQMIRVGDEIEMPQFNADGIVQEIGLTTIKVKNFDNSIAYIPTHQMLEESFMNLRDQEEAGVRKLEHSFHINSTSVNFCNQSQLENIKKIKHMHEHVDANTEENPTNLGLFRVYIENYLRSHSRVDKEKPMFVQLQDSALEGLPLQFEVFTTELSHSSFLKVKADVVEHLLAMAHKFKLEMKINYISTQNLSQQGVEP